MRFLRLLAPVLSLALFAAGCAQDDEVIDFDLPLGQTGLAMNTAGEAPAGLQASAVNGVDTEVWAVTRDWGDVDSEAGMAWGAGSGLNWEQKYSAWVQSMEETATSSGSRSTFIVTTPYGKSLAVPYLECAELAMTMRVLFASWYGLPFYMQANDASGTTIYAGHFGFRTDAGRYKNSARYKNNYNDYSHLSAEDVAGTWPTDSKLRGRSIYGGQDDNDFLAEGAKSGHYFDELLLNKRVGYFLLNLLPFFGSINIADPVNAWDPKAESLRGGDVLLKRWKRTGIGHVMLVKSVDERANGKLTATLASGSMPRRQAVWESPAASKMLFTHDATGSANTSYDGERYVELGGGLKRWPSPALIGGRWTNRVLPSEMADFIHRSDEDAIAERPVIFETLLVTPSPEVLRDELLAIIESKRAWLRDNPSSCSARSAREDAFEELYELMEDKFGMNALTVDIQYRELEDYVFAELVYEESRTCCWNSSTRAMYDTAIDLAVESTSGQVCSEPLTFMMRDGAYDDFSSHADTLGLPFVDWSADESCPQAETVTTDTETEHAWQASWCELELLRDTDPQPGDTSDPYEANNTFQEAYPLGAGTWDGGRITENDADWFKIDAPRGALVRARIEFQHSAGDLDLKMYEGNQEVDSSTGTDDDEQVDTTWEGESALYVKVYGYRDAQNPYRLIVTTEGGIDLGDPCDDDNETMETAFELGAGIWPGLAICSNDVDWFRIPATTGSFVVRMTWGNGAGPFDVELLRSNGEAEGSVTFGTGWAEIESRAGLRFLRVAGRDGATGAYDLTIE